MKALVITTINPPTVALSQYAEVLLPLGWKIIVVGDKKTPQDFHLSGVDYLSVEKQDEYFGEIANLIPFNHYSRKNLGYLYAMQQGAEAIAETDDDNIPYLDKYPNFLPAQVTAPLLKEAGAVNIYSYFTSQRIWPRGLPLDRINQSVNSETLVETEVTCYIQQGLADLDPDVDAIYRLTSPNGDIVFEPNKKIALGAGCYCPINTQNTIFYQEVFPFLFLPITVNSRVTDIWKGYIAQRLLWCLNSNLLFISPSVYQIRNEHNLLKDFSGELDLYTQAHELIEMLNQFTSSSRDAKDLMLELYQYLNQIKFFNDEELKGCQAWIEAVQKYS